MKLNSKKTYTLSRNPILE